MEWFLYDNGLRHERVKCFLCKYERIRKFCDAQKKKGNFEIELRKRFHLENCENLSKKKFYFERIYPVVLIFGKVVGAVIETSKNISKELRL